MNVIRNIFARHDAGIFLPALWILRLYHSLFTDHRRKKTRMSGFLSSCFIAETACKQN